MSSDVCLLLKYRAAIFIKNHFEEIKKKTSYYVVHVASLAQSCYVLWITLKWRSSVIKHWKKILNHRSFVLGGVVKVKSGEEVQGYMKQWKLDEIVG